VVEGTRLLSGFSSKDGTGVRISPSPFRLWRIDYGDKRIDHSDELLIIL
jgi:hypothetical protein